MQISRAHDSGFVRLAIGGGFSTLWNRYLPLTVTNGDDRLTKFELCRLAELQQCAALQHEAFHGLVASALAVETTNVASEGIKPQLFATVEGAT